MRHLPRARGRVAAGLLALVLAAGVVLLGPATPASAHGTLATSTPAEGATVDEALTAVQLYFTERVREDAYFTVTAPGGGRVDNGWTHGEPRELDRPVREYFLVDGVFEPREYTTGFPAVVTLAHLPAAGQYSVSYLSVASDGDPVRGTVTFRYTGKPTAAPPNWQPPTGQPDPSLLAAAEQHGDTGSQAGSGDATPVAPTAPVPSVAAAPPASDDSGGIGALGWAALVAAVVAVAGFFAWQHRPARVDRSRTAARRSGATRPRAKPTTRSKGGRTTAAATGRRGTAAGPAARRGRKAATVSAAAPAQRAVATTPVAPAEPAEAAALAAPGTPADGSGPTGWWHRGDTRLALLVGGLVLTLLAGFALGRIDTSDEPTSVAQPPGAAAVGGSRDAAQAVTAGDGHQHPAGIGPHTHPGDGQDQATGTTVSAAGYTLKPVLRSQPAGATTDYRFRVVGVDGQPVTRFAVVHDKPLHMIVVGRDLGGYQHLHPTMAADGTWSVPLELTRPGGYRIYADFTVTTADGKGLPLVLGVDHEVPGGYDPAGLPPPQPRTTTGPYVVSMAGTPTIGMTVPLTLRVDRDGAAGPVQLERYLGAYGHLVVVREGDLGFLHVHPEPELVDGTVKFWLTAPSTGRYRAFFDFQVDGKVHTAAFTINLA
ncbi:copper resistance protein CopC [Verrucosispora sp. WMMC514]|uniref:copper resistance CopC family protein n=1 Tax=Verrucosispora sp. WMMC514 TaxID=3015156 RepID=UPI00248D3983|nr:copper resistance protein CopC [Verrucosispora sp. WMMC514]WBB90299.1 copper resistance protein CopC [Verrucosispora sp. WMMC514]